MFNPLLGMLLSAAFVNGQISDAPSDTAIREAVQRSLPFIEKEGIAWMDDRKCLSCHVVTFMLWSHNEAKASGVSVDDKKLQEWTSWSLDYSLGARQWYKVTDEAGKKLKADGLADAAFAKLKPLKNKTFAAEEPFLEAIGKLLTPEELDPNKDFFLKLCQLPAIAEKSDGGSMATMGQLLVGRVGNDNPRMKEFLESAPVTLQKWQTASGSWAATGQLGRQNRPRAETDEVTTGWAILGLASLDNIDPATRKSIDAGLAYFKKAKTNKNHEKLLVSMLVADKFGKPGESSVLLKEVLSKQNPDGGWAWNTGGASDAFATGQSLYALCVMSAKADPAVIGRARKYLLATQDKEGIWPVPPLAITDSKSDESRVEKLIPIYHFWGTAWAAIGLSRSLSPTAR